LPVSRACVSTVRYCERRAASDAVAINLWAGQSYSLAQERPAAELMKAWSAEIHRLVP
jgi:NAD(P)H-dependent flavin oxidoreductase YrpB (nitropropane dioxygenase family)